jgi:phytoene synthase
MPNTSHVEAQCNRMLRGGSRTFFAASLFLPAAVRSSATALYAFCRMADDAIDQGHDRERALRDLHARLDLIYQQRPGHDVADRAFARAVADHSIAKAIPLALLEGFSWDADNRRYETLSQLTDYAVRVAGTVGLMMSWIMGVQDRASLARACDLGVAMQLTNIARDVGEDARNGRLYLPLQWMREAHIDPQAWLNRPVFDAALAGVIQRLLETAEALYLRSEAGLSRLPRACRPSMYAARMLYAEIGHEVARRNFDSVSQRAVVKGSRKLRLVARALLASQRLRSTHAGVDCLPESEFLVGLISVTPDATLPSHPLADRLVGLINLFERLERLERGEFKAPSAAFGMAAGIAPSAS